MTEKFVPHISPETKVAEFSFKAIFLGLILGIVFAIGNAYLALKIGTTISASIPAAIISMALFRFFFKRSTSLENNIVQTIATVGEGLAAGVTFTLPALFFLGSQPSIGKIFLISSLGGVLGILLMIPMRRYIIVKEHGKLPFPEGTACAQIIQSGQKSKDSAFLALWGILTGFVYRMATSALFLWQEIFEVRFSSFYGTLFSLDASSALLGVGYLIGPRICSLMFAGGAVAWWVFIPLIKIFGEGSVIIYPSSLPISEMQAPEIWSNYIRYIGAGCVGIGGLLGLFKILPILGKTLHGGVLELFSSFREKAPVLRTEKDIPLLWLLIGSMAILLTFWLLPSFSLNGFSLLLIFLLGFFFVAVTSLTVGLVGSTSNPVSGMTITTLLIISFCFVGLGWTERAYLIMAITMSCIINIAICLAGTTSQDLKTGYLLGATPIFQQLAEIIGVILPSFALGGALYLLNEAYHIGSALMPAPQASLMAMIVEGVISGKLPYGLVLIGVILGFLLQILRIPILPFALGLYLPLSLTSATMVGAVAAWVVFRLASFKQARERGTLLASGIIGGDACTGILIAGLTILGILPPQAKAFFPSWVTLLSFLVLAYFLTHFTLKKSKKPG